MEKSGDDGDGESRNDAVNVEVVMHVKEPFRVWDGIVLLRVLALGLTLVSTTVMFLAKETQTVQVQVVPTLPALSIIADAKSSYSSAFVYFIVVNTIACAHAALSLLLFTVKRQSNGKTLSLFIIVADVLMVALLYSGNGAAAAVGVVGKNGNTHIGWNKICGVFGRFCKFVEASIAVSLLGSLVYLVLVTISIVNLHKRSLK